MTSMNTYAKVAAYAFRKLESSYTLLTHTFTVALIDGNTLPTLGANQAE